MSTRGNGNGNPRPHLHQLYNKTNPVNQPGLYEEGIVMGFQTVNLASILEMSLIKFEGTILQSSPPRQEYGYDRFGNLRYCRGVNTGQPYCSSLLVELESAEIDSDLVIYRTTLVRTFQVVTICRVDKSEIRQSGPRPDPRLLRQTALEVLTRSARSDSPRKTRPEQNSGEVGRRRRRTAAAAAAA
ncbi:hypothetical protein F511_33169 [Dorcoceras hygrometricum]|uniref:Uncharacterized protein n=1 Tax=Dorcoceras hygrometricum TaxID=472368 RepID=A0A2Z7D5M0_9LAMI|nr:hypothetical protein F511_33169 [Dorcoceras hygrometricum]